jgi:hypothetical protein
MFEANDFENAAARRGLYRVWIRAHEGENAALISVWVDPAMRAFEPSAGTEAACDVETAPDLPLMSAELAINADRAAFPGYVIR